MFNRKEQLNYMHGVIFDFLIASKGKPKNYATTYVKDIDLESHVTPFWFALQEYIDKFCDTMNMNFSATSVREPEFEAALHMTEIYFLDFQHLLVNNDDALQRFRYTQSKVDISPWYPSNAIGGGADFTAGSEILKVICPMLRKFALELRKKLKADGYEDILIEETAKCAEIELEKWNNDDPVISFYSGGIHISHQVNSPNLYLYTINNQNTKKHMRYNRRYFIHWLIDGSLFWTINELVPTLEAATKGMLKETPTGYFNPRELNKMEKLGFEIESRDMVDKEKTYRAFSMEWGDTPYRQRAIIICVVNEHGYLEISNLNTTVGKKFFNEINLVDRLADRKIRTINKKKK